MTESLRYDRQTGISQLGKDGQEKLKKSSVAVVGCGGLGSPVLTYLTLAGVGKIRLIDYDVISISNLNRQFLYEESDIEKKKSVCAKEFLEKRNHETQLEYKEQKLTQDNAKELLGDMDVVVDCVDDVLTRKLVSRSCVMLQIPLIEGGIHGFYGYVMPVMPGKSACLECTGAIIPKKEQVIPALGAVAGVIGSLQAVECLKILLNKGDVHFGSLLQYDGLCTELTEVKVLPCETCFCQSYKNDCKGW